MRRSASASARPAPAARRAATTSRWARAASARSPASSAWAACASSAAIRSAAALALRPQVERLAAEPRGVAVGVDGGALGRSRRAAPRARAADRARRASAWRSRPGSPPRALEPLGQVAVQRAAPQPRDVLVDRVARERVAERGPAVALLADEAGGDELAEPVVAAEARRRASRSKRWPATAAASAAARAPVGERRGADQHGVADRLRQRHVLVERERQARRAGGQAVGVLQREGELLDEERRCRRCGRRAARAEPRGRRRAEHAARRARRPRRRSAARARPRRARRSRRRSWRRRRSGCERGSSSER